MEKYLKLLDDIMQDGVYKEPDREGMPGSKSLFGYQMRFDLSEGFPLLTTKKMFWKGIVTELIWFLKGDTNIKFLIDNQSNFWTDDAYNYYRKRCEYRNIPPWPKDLFVSFIRTSSNLEHPEIPGYSFGDCGFQYGKLWRNWTQPEVDEDNEFTGNFVKVDQIKRVLKSLINNPQSRRHIVTAIDPINDNDLALYWCHCLMQFNARPLNTHERCEWLRLSKEPLLNLAPDTSNVQEWDKFLDNNNIPKYYLDCQLYQRSADTFPDVPFNIASYALLIELFSKIVNMVPGHLVQALGDVYIYENHYEQVKTQSGREPFKLPGVSIKIDHILKQVNEDTDLSWLLNQLDFNMFELIDYKSHPSIKAILSTGTGE